MQKLTDKQVFASIYLILAISVWLMMSLHNPVVMYSGMILIAFIIARIILYFHAQTLLLKILAFLLPFSFESPFFGSSVILLPTEPLIVILVFVMMQEILQEWTSIRKRRFMGEMKWILPLMLVYVITIPFSGMVIVSAKFSLINLLYILVFFIYLSIRLSRHTGLFPELIFAYSTGLFLVLAWSLYKFGQWEWNPVVVRGIFRPFYKDHTIFGATAAMLAAFWFSVKNQNRFSAWSAFMMGMIFLLSIFLSGSRAALLSMFFFGMVYFLLSLRINRIGLIIVLLLPLILVYVQREPLMRRLQAIQQVSHDVQAGIADKTISSANISSDVSNLERMNRWVSAYRMFLEKPFTGFGPGTYQFTYIPYQEPSMMTRISVTDPYNPPENSGGTAHSEYLLTLSEMGVFGLMAWLIILGRLTFIAFDNTIEKRKRRDIMVAYGALSTYMFHAFFNNFLTTDKFAFLFWGTAAWLIAVYHSENEGILQKD
jgi:putative inorganic carbon (hco3(-)) transporter